MGVTPIEGRDESEDRGPTAGRQSGVRPRLRALASWIGAALGRLLPGRGTSEDGGTREEAREENCRAIRPSGERKLEGTRRRQTPKLPREAQGGHGGREEGAYDATMVGQRLRIQDTDRPDAYISSDVYERIER